MGSIPATGAIQSRQANEERGGKDSGQLTFQTMGGDTVVVPVRGKHYIEPRGYYQPPGIGPAGETCGTCEHIARSDHYAKCELSRSRWTHSRGTDILVKAPACRRWESIKTGYAQSETK